MVVRPVVAPERGQQRLVVWHDWSELGVVAPIVNPAQRVRIGDQVVDRRVITQQLAHDWDRGLRVIGGNRQRVPDLLALLGAQDNPGFLQHLCEVAGAELAIPGQYLTQPLLERLAECRGCEPRQRISV